MDSVSQTCNVPGGSINAAIGLKSPRWNVIGPRYQAILTLHIISAPLHAYAWIIFSILCTKLNNCHCVFTFFLPRNVNRSIPLFFRLPNTGSTIAILFL